MKDLNGTTRFFFNGVLRQGSQRLSERIPVTLWFPFCGGQSCSVKKKKKRWGGGVGVGGLHSVSDCLWADSKQSEQLHGFLFLLSNKTHHRLRQHSLLRAPSPVLHASVLITSAAA